MPLTNQIQKRLEIYKDLLIYIHMSVYSIQTFFFFNFPGKGEKIKLCWKLHYFRRRGLGAGESQKWQGNRWTMSKQS